MERGAGSQGGQIRRLVTAHLPDYRVRSIARLAEGQENVAYEVNGELIVRFSKEPDPVRRAARVDREARLLAAVASISPLPVPEPELVAAEAGCLAYRKLPGLPLPDLPHQQLAARAEQVAAVLGTLLAALHAVPVERLAGLVGTDDQPLAGWRDDAGQDYRDTASVVPAARRGAIGNFLAAPPPPGLPAPTGRRGARPASRAGAPTRAPGCPRPRTPRAAAARRSAGSWPPGSRWRTARNAAAGCRPGSRTGSWSAGRRGPAAGWPRSAR